MAAPTNTFESYQSVGTREDLKDFISNIAPTATPFQTMAGKTDAENTYFSWQTDTLASPNTANAQIEGDDITTFDAVTPTVRVGNNTQISRKTVVIAGTQDATVKAGRGKKEIAYQVTKKTKELKRDMEAILTGNNPSYAGTSTAARTTAGLESWFVTNTNRGTGGANGGFSNQVVAAPTDGTQRAFTETLLKSALQQQFTSGGDGDIIMVGPTQKQEFSTFSGNSERKVDASDKKLFAGVDIYDSDFGELKCIPNRFQRTRTAFVLQSDMWSVAYLRPFVVSELAKTGDSTKRLLISEYGLLSKNEAASAVIADIT